MNLKHLTIVACATLLTFAAFANEPYAPREFWLSQGYREQSLRKAVVTPPTWAPHSLSWPIAFQDVRHSLGNSMLEFQSYGDGPYYHGGCDLRVQSRAAVTTPVAGRIEAGHYGYVNKPDGSSSKMWIPWPGQGDEYYFEIAVITDDNYRFEFHHMDETQIAPQVLAILRSGHSTRVEAGTVLGKTVAWPDGIYHHTHYNIIAPDGVHLNPEYYSPLIPDLLAPQVTALFAISPSGAVTPFGNGELTSRPAYIAAVITDKKNDNVYVHPPVIARIDFDNGAQFGWNFTERLADANNLFPPIWDFYIEELNGQKTEGGYGTGQSIIKIPVPKNGVGHFTLHYGDAAGNFASFFGSIRL